MIKVSGNQNNNYKNKIKRNEARNTPNFHPHVGQILKFNKKRMLFTKMIHQHYDCRIGHHP